MLGGRDSNDAVEAQYELFKLCEGLVLGFWTTKQGERFKFVRVTSRFLSQSRLNFLNLWGGISRFFSILSLSLLGIPQDVSTFQSRSNLDCRLDHMLIVDWITPITKNMLITKPNASLFSGRFGLSLSLSLNFSKTLSFTKCLIFYAGKGEPKTTSVSLFKGSHRWKQFNAEAIQFYFSVIKCVDQWANFANIPREKKTGKLQLKVWICLSFSISSKFW